MRRFAGNMLVALVGFLALGTVTWAQIAIDIKPGAADGANPLQTKAKGNGVTPVAVLCTTDFDPATIDQSTVFFGAAPAERCALVDENLDGCVDLSCKFPTALIGVTCQTESVILTAQLVDGTVVTGSEAVTPKPCPKPKPPKATPDEELDE